MHNIYQPQLTLCLLLGMLGAYLPRMSPPSMYDHWACAHSCWRAQKQCSSLRSRGMPHSHNILENLEHFLPKLHTCGCKLAWEALESMDAGPASKREGPKAAFLDASSSLLLTPIAYAITQNKDRFEVGQGMRMQAERY